MSDLLIGWPVWLVPIFIFCARLCDVTFATVRIIFINRGLRRVAPLIGFFEILIWLVALSQVFQHLDRPLNFVAYAAGFAAGTYAGMFVEGKLAVGLVSVQVITQEDASELIARLGEERFGVTSVGARGLTGRVRLIVSIVRRRDLERVVALVRDTHPKAFISVSDVRAASEGTIARGPLLDLGGLWGMRRGK
jgi:uncharacterized protein YebE (UPF0316 family)